MTTMIEELPVIVNRKIWMSAFEKGEEKKDYFSISVLLKLKGCLQ